MSKRWKLKTNSSNILLVLITLILIKAEWVTGSRPEIVGPEEKWQTRVFVGHDEISRHYFRPSTGNDSAVLEQLQSCLENFQLVTCLKMLLLSRINEAVKYVEEPEVVGKDLHFLNGLMVLKRKNETSGPGHGENSQILDLDEEIELKTLRLFRNRFLLIDLLPEFKIQMEPNPTASDLICFKYKFQKEPRPEDGGQENGIEGRGKKGGMGMMMLVPPMIMLGLMPFTLASLKAMVMNAVMINMMALNGAIFMTIRNLVFGPRQGENVKYVNYGYSKDRQTQSKKPVLIIHSPAAFVKQPPVKTNRNPVQFHEKPNHHAENYFPPGDPSLHHQHHAEHYENPGSGDYYLIRQDHAEEIHNRRSIRRKEQRTAFNRGGNVRGRSDERVQRQKFPHPPRSPPDRKNENEPEMRGETDRNGKFASNESSPGLVYSNYVGKNAGGDFDYSRQVGQSSRLF